MYRPTPAILRVCDVCLMSGYAQKKKKRVESSGKEGPTADHTVTLAELLGLLEGEGVEGRATVLSFFARLPGRIWRIMAYKGGCP